MAEVFGHLGGGGGGDLHPVEVDLEDVGDDLGDLGVEALAHLGAAVVQVHRAVVVDVDQGAGLVVPGGGEGDAELDRRQADALADHRVGGVVGDDRLAAGLVVGGGFELVDDAVDDVVGDGLVVGRHVAVGGAVEVGAADLERVLAEGVGDLLHDPLGGDEALRAAEAAEGGVGDRVGLHRLGDQPYRRVVVGVVGVEEGAVGDRAGEVGGEAAAGGEAAVDGEDAAGVVEADLVLVQEVVALAGGDHVVVAVGADLHGAVELLGGDGGDGGEQVRLGFLAAEAAAHAADDDGHGVRRNAEDVGDHVLHLGRVLGRGIDGDVVVLAGDGEGDHALEVEMVLAADALHALEAVRRGRHRGGDVAAFELQAAR